MKDLEKLLDLRERIHDILERRFLSGENILYDYAGPNGEVVLPTPEETLENKPNAFAWNTPIDSTLSTLNSHEATARMQEGLPRRSRSQL